MESRASLIAARIVALSYPKDTLEMADKVVRAIFEKASYYGVRYPIYPKELGRELDEIDVRWGRSGAALYRRLRELFGQMRHHPNKVTFDEVMTKVRTSFIQNPAEVAERVARSFMAGEDWVLTDDINRLLPQVVQEIRRRGGSSTLTGGRIIARKFVLDMLHAIPLEIRLYEGTYYPGKVLVEATFSGRNPVPVRDRQPFNAKAVVDSIVEAFMSLVNYREARADDLGLRPDSADAVILPGLNEEMDQLEYQPHKMWTAARAYSRDSASAIAEEVVASGKSKGWIVPNIKDPSHRRVVQAAIEVEKVLAKFNIGYTDDMNGDWTHVAGGTRFFEGMV